MSDESSPAVVDVASPEVTTAAPASTETPAPVATETPAAAPTKPDFRTLLDSDPDLRKDYEHRVASEAGRRAKTEREAWQREESARIAAEQQRDLETRLARLVQEDPEHPLAQQLRPVLDANERQRREVDMRQQTAKQAGAWWLDMLTAQVQAHPDLSDEQKAELNPRNTKFNTPDDFFRARDEAIVSARLEREIAKRLPTEVEARVQERLGQLRAGEQTPANLPPGAASSDDKQFLVDYGEGRSSDHARARRLLAS